MSRQSAVELVGLTFGALSENPPQHHCWPQTSRSKGNNSWPLPISRIYDPIRLNTLGKVSMDLERQRASERQVSKTLLFPRPHKPTEFIREVYMYIVVGKYIFICPYFGKSVSIITSHHLTSNKKGKNKKISIKRKLLTVGRTSKETLRK